MPPSPKPRSALLSTTVLAILACGEEPTEPPPPEPRLPTTLAIVTGNAQEGFRGQPLSDSLVVRVDDQHGVPLDGTPVRFTVVLGGGDIEPTVTQTRGGGRAAAAWTLGPNPGTNRVRVTLTTGGGGMEFDATALDFPVEDVVVLSNTLGHSNGIVVDGLTEFGPIADHSVVSADTVLNVGALQAAAGSNEILAFTVGRPPAVVANAPWTDTNDTVRVAFRGPLRIPVTIWIVKGPFARQRARAAEAVALTADIFESERLGVEFSTVDFEDATADSSAATFFQFTCALRAGLQSRIGDIAGRINVYYVETVDGSTSRGQACRIGSDFVALGEMAGSDLLSHELGHDFGLIHPDDLNTLFDQTNVMHSASSVRQYLTEGQNMRAVLGTQSALNTVYRLRNRTRVCPRDVVSATCLAIAKRLWADGRFPAN